MAPRPIAYNLLRLILAATHTTPRGVDRIDYGYISYLLDHWPEDVVGVMPTLIGPRYFRREQLMKARERLNDLWHETADPDGDSALARLIQRFDSPGAPEPPPKPRGFLPGAKGIPRIAKLILGGGVTLGKPITALPPNALYLDIGHYGLTFPRAFRWRWKRPDIRTIFMVHDTIPLEYPEFVAEETFRAHQRLVGKTAKYADTLIVPTRSAGKAVQDALAQHRERPIAIHALPLPIDDLFSRKIKPLRELRNRPYFMICGAVEPRKNHLLLIEVWRELIRRHDDGAPKLIVAGSPGYASQDIIRELTAEESLRRHVLLASGLSSPAMARLMAGARAVLMPSFAEGFGLPPGEALSVGTPALVSDIPAHREAVGEAGEFLPPKNPDPWVDAIEKLRDDSYFQARRAAAHRFKPRRWDDYMRDVTNVLINETDDA
ncbi:MAG: glycosyltransferase family 4 protein [Beijerinckiaceae bacterium]|jgi:glycosyltransferase involved in cell wall biosynthesis|nr:glycosyltransferase family 4 protein [Beijerinckiaceae bacterium]